MSKTEVKILARRKLQGGWSLEFHASKNDVTRWVALKDGEEEVCVSTADALALILDAKGTYS